MNQPKVTAFGSCRVYDPLITLQRRGLIRLNSAGWNAYTHQTEDALQQLEIREGRLAAPFALSPLVFDKHASADEQVALLGPWRPSETDVAVVEIATLKVFSANGLYTQDNHAYRHLVEAFGTTPESRQYWSAAASSKRDQERIDSLLPPEMSAELREAARALRVHYQQPEEIIAGMRRLAERLGRPIIWVCHNRLPNERGDHAPQREVVAEALRQGAEALGHSFLDPTSHVEAYGQARAMAQEGRDLNHYSSEYLPVFGDVLLQAIARVLEPSSDHMAAHRDHG